MVFGLLENKNKVPYPVNIFSRSPHKKASLFLETVTTGSKWSARAITASTLADTTAMYDIVAAV